MTSKKRRYTGVISALMLKSKSKLYRKNLILIKINLDYEKCIGCKTCSIFTN
jgi:Pyruvate/2-oxoacid:ferredoxin oxidoreductase delta subunit